MNSITINPNYSAIDAAAIERGLQRGRQMRSKALVSLFKGMIEAWRRQPEGRDHGLTPGAAAPA